MIRRLAPLALAVSITLGTAGASATPTPAPAGQNLDCVASEEFIDAVQATADDLDRTDASRPDASVRILSDALTEMAMLTPPPAFAEAHANQIISFHYMALALTEMKHGDGVRASMLIDEATAAQEEFTDELDRAMADCS